MKPLPLLLPQPPMTETELIAAKWGLTQPAQRDIAVAALYWYDEAHRWRIAVEAKLRKEREL